MGKKDFRVISYNIHKCLSIGGLNVVAHNLKNALHSLDPDIAFLQEVVGKHEHFQTKHKNWPSTSQHEYFQSSTLIHSSYGKNANYPAGHHGNAILSKHRILYENNLDISLYKFSQRGFLHVKHEGPGGILLHSCCVHLGLMEQERTIQTSAICEYVRKNIPEGAPLLLVGDFNDWREKISTKLKNELQVQEAFLDFYGSHARSFPAWFPISCLDRIYFRKLKLQSCERLAGKPWSTLSDHLPLIADFSFTE